MRIMTTAAILVVGLMATACQTHEQGVKSNYMTQWTNVAANTEVTTQAAKNILHDEGLQDVKASSTKLDGTASGHKADGTRVMVTVKKMGDAASQVSVNVGKMGDPAVGSELAKKIKDRAEHP